MSCGRLVVFTVDMVLFLGGFVPGGGHRRDRAGRVSHLPYGR
ncbi:hypothetical protein UO65_4368 [Actinokineospora spheciospongiae]|uniref:Uncharacterized protein n=1 Tax=Actinokineospora spheciospongiae TaxID=909613 RepID=W7IH91_9PSEU|nr:hypothetical protein UO65_4368 [Actinokineospora spheciospongiae]